MTDSFKIISNMAEGELFMAMAVFIPVALLMGYKMALAIFSTETRTDMWVNSRMDARKEKESTILVKAQFLKECGPKMKKWREN
jgi:hypothetical protein